MPRELGMRRIGKTVFAYGLWIALSALAVVDVFAARSWWLAVMRASGVAQETARFLDKALVVLCGIGVLVLFIAAESWLVNGSRRGILARRACRLGGIELLVLASCELTLAFLPGTALPPLVGPVPAAGIGAVGAGLLAILLLPRRSPADPPEGQPAA